METHIHTGYTSGRGSPAWKHTFTQEDRPIGLHIISGDLRPDFGGQVEDNNIYLSPCNLDASHFNAFGLLLLNSNETIGNFTLNAVTLGASSAYRS